MAWKISKGIIPSYQKVVIYGPAGVGKTTFATQFPNPLFLDKEDGSKFLDVSRADGVDTWAQVKAFIADLCADTQGFQTLVIDTADWFQLVCDADILARYNKLAITDIGYGVGTGEQKTEFVKILNMLRTLSDKMNVVFLAHDTVERIEPPMLENKQPYDRMNLKCAKAVSALICEWADTVLYMQYDEYATKKDKSSSVKVISGEQIFFTKHSPYCMAKNRWGLPEKIPAKFEEIESFIPQFMSEKKSAVPQPKAQQSAATQPPQKQASGAVQTPQTQASQAPDGEDDEIPMSYPADKIESVILSLSQDPKEAEEIANLKLRTTKGADGVMWINQMQTWRDLDAARINIIASNPDKFVKSAIAFFTLKKSQKNN